MRSNENLVKNLKVLYIEDDPEVVEQMRYFLRKRVGTLEIAMDGEEGYHLFKKTQPDLIISDLQMPRMDGLMLANNIRKTSNVPIIFTTAYSERETLLKAIDAGICSYLIKPIDAGELMEALEKAALDIFRSNGTLVSIKQRHLAPAEKLYAEDQLKNAFAKTIKDLTGKGPQYVKVFIHGDRLDVEIGNAFTRLEKTLLETESNVSFVKFNRELLYKSLEPHFSDKTQHELGTDVFLTSMEIDVKTDIHNLIYTFTS